MPKTHPLGLKNDVPTNYLFCHGIYADDRIIEQLYSYDFDEKWQLFVEKGNS